VPGVDVNREQRAQRHEEDLGALINAKPQNHQRDQRQMRHVAQHLDRGIQQALAPA
jgi:hypothetical protein